MGKSAQETLAITLRRLIGPGGYFASNAAAEAKSGVGRSTFDRARKGTTGLRLDNLQEIASAFRLEAWQMLVPDVDPNNPPKLANPSGAQEAPTAISTTSAICSQICDIVETLDPAQQVEVLGAVRGVVAMLERNASKEPPAKPAHAKSKRA